MAQGIRHGRSELCPKRTGNDEENDGAACTAGKDCFPMLSLSVKPKIALDWLYVTT